MSKDTNDPAEMIVATYSPHLDTSNIEKVIENWKITLRVKHGPITSFLTTEEYPVIKEPEEPILTGLTAGSLKYEATKKAYLDGVSESVKENRRMTLERPKIAATMLAHISPECLAHCSRDGDWQALVDAADDPLAIWKSMSKSMRSRTVGDTLRARKSVCQAYSRHIMKEGQSLAAYTKEREHLLASMKALGVADKEPDELIMDYIDGLHRGRYSSLQIHVQNERDRMPKTMQEAYSMVADWVVTVTRRAESYVSERVDKKKNKDKKGSSSPKRDMSKVKCFNCGEMGHLARSCPNTKKGDDDDDEDANLGERLDSDEDSCPALIEEESDDEDEESFICYKSRQTEGASGERLQHRT
jgi:Zinc knuckle